MSMDYDLWREKYDQKNGIADAVTDDLSQKSWAKDVENLTQQLEDSLKTKGDKPVSISEFIKNRNDKLFEEYISDSRSKSLQIIEDEKKNIEALTDFHNKSKVYYDSLKELNSDVKSLYAGTSPKEQTELKVFLDDVAQKGMMSPEAIEKIKNNPTLAKNPKLVKKVDEFTKKYEKLELYSKKNDLKNSPVLPQNPQLVKKLHELETNQNSAENPQLLKEVNALSDINSKWLNDLDVQTQEAFNPKGKFDHKKALKNIDSFVKPSIKSRRQTIEDTQRGMTRESFDKSSYIRLQNKEIKEYYQYLCRENPVITASKNTSKVVLKKIPGVGLVAGTIYATERWKKGDKKGAVAELASGLSSCVPGAGTVGSLVVDGGLIYKDAKTIDKNAKRELDELYRDETLSPEELTEKVTKVVQNQEAAQAIMKKTPLLGAAAGFARIHSDGKIAKDEIANVASGMTGSIPGVGTVASLAIDSKIYQKNLDKEKIKIAMKSEQKKHKIVQEKLDKPVAELQDDLNNKAMRDVNDELDLDALRKREEAFDKKTEDFKSHKIQKPEIILDMKPPKLYPYKHDDVR